MNYYARAAVCVGMAVLFAGCGGKSETTGGDQTAKGGKPGIPELQRALDKQLKALRPEGMTERDVLFQTAVAGQTPGHFRATVTIRDYGPGYPKNKFYGTTCVGQLVDEDFALEADDFGGWRAQGRLTPDMSKNVCKDNPAEGVSSQPLAGLPGIPAPQGTGVASLAPTAGGAVAPGPYECWGNGQAHTFMNFTVTGTDQYKGSDGVVGHFSVDAKTSRVTFNGGSLDGALPAGFYTVYHLSQGRPAFSFRNSGGDEASFCEKK